MLDVPCCAVCRHAELLQRQLKMLVRDFVSTSYNAINYLHVAPYNVNQLDML